MIRPIVQYGEPVLRAKCAPVEEVTDEIRELVDDMLETMRHAEGVGLAAPQVGVPLQLAVIDVSHDPECVTYLRVDGVETSLEELMPLIFINPDLGLEAPKVADNEGCLSFPEIRAPINRPEQVKATLKTLEGKTIVVETDGLLSRAIQHETDHLNGILFIDRMNAASKVSLKGRLRRLKAHTTGSR
ncbi:MAG: peptide deformylase [Verrucomicrobiota bacterium]